MENEYDWEEWDSSSLSFGHHMVAGCIAGVSEHIAFFPIDTLKVQESKFTKKLDKSPSECPFT